MKSIQKWLLVIILFSSTISKGQEKEEFKPVIKWNMTSQIWFRYSDLNEGSLIDNEFSSSFMDISIRRLRIPISSQITPKIFVYSIFGGNNYNFKNKTFQLEVLDLYVEYTFDKAFEVGLGKSGWQGLNRWNIRSAKTLMGLDSPLFTLNSVEKNDDLGRLFGAWIKGQYGRLDYRLAFNRPFITTAIPQGKVGFANNKPRVKTSTYVKYQFFEHESNKSAYQTGTYGNTKKVFNIGLGYQYQENAMSDGDAMLASTNLYDMKHWAIDSFLNLPFSNETAITAYLGYYDYDFGKDYIRNVGANNPTTGGGTDFNGAGVAFPMIGSGTTWYMQFGYALKASKIMGQNFVIQPNIAIQTSNWDALNDQMTVYDFTVNFLLDGKHNTKFSLGYQHRPIFDATTIQQKGYKGMAVLQYQISLK
ncbi:porin family protein [Polaribacter aquimarinus]|uniref:Porin n=1 Tax=Polaribacter aquimarinus TaxID=2100726 RepID=A0A2U2JE36_9FLAO|nr:porin [Polaribacter aquimarinus]PWG06597.1 porin [Polaribacter aquimarinus]